jgi:hypothetical protein
MKQPFIFAPLALCFGLLTILAQADPPGGKGRGKGGMRGPLPAEQREIIHELAENHKKLSRKVTLTAKGYEATTTSEDADLAAKLKTHFRYMQKRLDAGAMVRRWDPAYAELTEYYDKLEVKVEELPDGLKVTVTGKNAKAVKVAQNHASIVTSFVKKGSKELPKEHDAAN